MKNKNIIHGYVDINSGEIGFSIITCSDMGFPGGTVVKNSLDNAGDIKRHRFNP